MSRLFQFLCLILLLSMLGCAQKESLLDSYSDHATTKKAASGETALLDEAADDDAIDVQTVEDVEATTTSHAQHSVTGLSTPDSTVAALPKNDRPSSPAQAKISVEQFQMAALNGQGPVVVAAVDAGFDVNTLGENGQTALMLASYNGHMDIVQFLMKYKADVNLRDVMQRNALFYAASGKFPDVVALLLEADAEVNVPDTQERWTALMMAAAEGNEEVVKLLLKHGADRKLADVDGETAEQFAASKGHANVVKLLQGEEK